MGVEDKNSHETFLVLKAQSGDLSAFDELLRSIQLPLHRYIKRIAIDSAAADDILQDVFLIIYRKLGWLNDTRLFRAWAYRIASRETFRFLKRQSWISHDQIEDDLPALTDERPYDREMLRQIPDVLSEVSPASRAVIVLHYLDEFTISETAKILGINTGTVKSRLAYGLRAMRRKFEKFNESKTNIV